MAYQNDENDKMINFNGGKKMKYKTNEKYKNIEQSFKNQIMNYTQSKTILNKS